MNVYVADEKANSPGVERNTVALKRNLDFYLHRLRSGVRVSSQINPAPAGRLSIRSSRVSRRLPRSVLFHLLGPSSNRKWICPLFLVFSILFCSSTSIYFLERKVVTDFSLENSYFVLHERRIQSWALDVVFLSELSRSWCNICNVWKTIKQTTLCETTQFYAFP